MNSFVTDADEEILAAESASGRVCVYEFEGCPTTVLVPEPYAADLNQVRHLRQQAGMGTPDASRLPEHPAYAWRALPEDIVAHLKALPNVDLVERLLLLDRDNPEEPSLREIYGPEFRSASAYAAERREIRLFRRDLDQALVPQLFHEWAHLLRHSLPEESHLFDLAAELEADGHFEDDWSTVNTDENWAVHLGEVVLHPDGDVFWQFLRQAPLRAVALGRALGRALESVREEHRSPYHQIFAERVRLIEQDAAPRAQQKLLQLASAAAGMPLLHTAATLLIYIGTAEQVASLRGPAKLDLSFEYITDAELSKLSAATWLVELDLTGTFVTPEGLTSLEGLVGLEKLALRRTRVTNSSLASLSPLFMLKELDLSDTGVNDTGLSLLMGLVSLRRLDLRHTGVTEFGAGMVRTRLPGCHVLI